MYSAPYLDICESIAFAETQSERASDFQCKRPITGEDRRIRAGKPRPAFITKSLCAAHVPECGEAIGDILLCEMEAYQYFDRRLLKRLPGQIQSIDAEMNMSIDEIG